MRRECNNKTDAATTRTNNHKWPYSSFVSNAFAGGSAFMQPFLLKCLSWRLLNRIAVNRSLGAGGGGSISLYMYMYIYNLYIFIHTHIFGLCTDTFP